VPIKLDCFQEEIVIEISCGFFHSMALTNKGHVFSWGFNKWEPSGIADENSNKPKLIELKNVLITKISCGQYHNLLLSNDGIIYGFGYNQFGQIGIVTKENQTKPKKLNHEKKFIDIASHWNYNISMALTNDRVFYVWGEFYKQSFSIPTETMFKSFNAIFAYYFEQNFVVSEGIIEFSDLYFRNGYYERAVDEIEKLGEVLEKCLK
jgi:alpha-tubulin suppressor-like RCC1 family protein